MTSSRTRLRVAVALATLALLGGCTGPQPSPAVTGGRPAESASVGAGGFPTQLLEIPPTYLAADGPGGELVELTYDTWESLSYEDHDRSLTKRAVVYLPAGYSEDIRYDVFYLMHGGWGNEASSLGEPGRPSTMKSVLDHAIAAGEIKPLIVVCPTYNNTSPQDSANFSLALTLTENYHRELLNDLVPAVETRFSTYAEDVSREGLAASRDHRGFGGFSMGAVATWRTFQNGLDYFRFFLPMSCGTALDDDVLAAARGREADDYLVWVITGTEDFARAYDEARVQRMRSLPFFAEAGGGRPGNFGFALKDGYGHDGRAAMEYTYNGLRAFWGR